MSLKVQELARKCWVIVNTLLPKILPKECWVLLKGNPPNCRARLYFAGVVVGLFLLLFLLLFFPSLQGNKVFQSALAVFFLTFPLVTINWLIKNRDVSQQLEYYRQQQNETLFSNSLQLLFKKEDEIANSVGLKELVKLKQERRIDPDRVDIITSSGLQIKKASLEKADLQKTKLQGANLQRANLQEAKLQGAELQRANLQVTNLQGADLQRANLQGAYLREANLKGANLQGANLQGVDFQKANLAMAKLAMANLTMAKLEESFYDKRTQFPDGFNPEQHGMELIEK